MASPEPRYELRKVAVLFTDLKGFARLSQSVSSPEIFRFLNRFFERLGEAIEAHDGYIDKFIGDAMMVVFDAGDSGQSARRAAGAARAMVHALRGWQVEGVEFNAAAGFGFDAGEVVYGPVGTRSRKDLTVYGQCVNRAAVLAGRAEPGQILTTQQTAELLGDALSVQPVGLRQIIGQEVSCYQVLVEN